MSSISVPAAQTTSPVYPTFEAMPDLFTVHAASLDDPGRYKPQMVISAVRGFALYHLVPALLRLDKMPRI